MMDGQLATDRRKRRIDETEGNIVRSLVGMLPAGARIADVPSGNGRLSQVVRRDDLDVVAMDFSLSMLTAMANRGDQAGSWLGRRVQADVTDLPLPDKSIDLFINMRLMHHIQDEDLQLRMYRQIGRVTRGKIITSFWTTHCWRYVRRRLRGKPLRGYAISPRRFQEICTRAGLTVERIVPTRRWWEEECVAICRP